MRKLKELHEDMSEEEQALIVVLHLKRVLTVLDNLNREKRDAMLEGIKRLVSSFEEDENCDSRG